MNFIKQGLTIALLLLYLPTIAQHSYPKPKVNADSAWSKLVLHSKKDTDFIAKQARFLKYREEGLKFWKMFPNDARRYEWFSQTVLWYPVYWKELKDNLAYRHLLTKDHFVKVMGYDIPLDKKKLKEWENMYPQLRKEFTAYLAQQPEFRFPFGAGFDGKHELKLIKLELYEFLSMSLNKTYRQKGKIDLEKLKTIFLSSGKYFSKDKLDSPTHEMASVFDPMDANFIACYQHLGLDQKDMAVFFDSIKSCPVPILRDWAIQRASLFTLMQNPFTLKSKSMDGNFIDLEQMRGKVVLVDFWALTCSTCIERMPAIKTVYDKYKTEGFEVISVCLENETDRKRVEVVEKKIGSDWPILLIGYNDENSLGKQIWKKYGFWGVPQLLLLNKQGKLVMLNDKLKNGDFEPDVKRLLAEQYNSN